MLPTDGPLVAPLGVGAQDWVRVLASERLPVALVPASPRGWFGGHAIVSWDPVEVREGLTPAEVGDGLDRCRASAVPCLGVALLPYDGPAVLGMYTGGLVRAGDGWRAWGTVDPSGVPDPAGSRAPVCPPDAALATDVRGDTGDIEFRRRVREVTESIRAGDVYVVNLTHRICGRPSVSAPEAFEALLSRSRADMGAFWATPAATIASASPERFLRVSGERVEVCPIKGTRPRARGAADRAIARELLLSEKERAEHVMIVDLVRNDLGRVCVPGSIEVDPLFDVVATPYCHQMVSSVSGSLVSGSSLADTLDSVFPCGSVTGAPKIAAMRRISDLERSPRDAYTGALLAAVPGELDSSILIRTAEYRGDRVVWGSGGGITIDSDPAEEWLETVLKASPFLGDGPPAVALRETCRVVGGRVPLFARHLARLAAGGCGPTVLSKVRSLVGEVLASQAPVGCVPAASRLAVSVDTNGRVDVELSDAPSSLEVLGDPVVAPVVVEVPGLPCGAAKPLDRALWDDAQRRAARLGAHQALLVDEGGRILDGATASLWIRVGSRLLTPPAPPAVHGVARGVVFDHAMECGYQPTERELRLEDIEAADEAFLCNALAGVAPLRGRSGHAAAKLADVFRAAFEG